MFDAILSIQSHVAFGYVGNKAATYPLQCLGYDVWPVHTVQFSNHTGYGCWQGDVFSAEHIRRVVSGIGEIGEAHRCVAILSGYMGSREICEAVSDIAAQFKKHGAIYLCDPVIGNNNCYVKPEVMDFFKENLRADIITPNQYEAEVLSGTKVTGPDDLRKIAAFFHDRGVSVVVITGINLTENFLHTFVSYEGGQFLLPIQSYNFDHPINGTGDLFSSVYLGHYLRKKDASYALQQATQALQDVLKATLGHRELQVLSSRYLESNQLSGLINLADF